VWSTAAAAAAAAIELCSVQRQLLSCSLRVAHDCDTGRNAYQPPTSYGREGAVAAIQRRYSAPLEKLREYSK